MNKNLPIVSIICTSYNHEKYITQTLDGFIMQKTTFPINIVVHDDASTDKTAEIVRAYEQKYPHLFSNIYQTENKYSKGNAEVTKIIFSCSKSKYLAICEGDDYWTDPYKLQKQVDFMEQNEEYSFIFHNAVIHYVDKNVYEDFNHNLRSRRYKTRDLLIKNWFIPTASLLIRNEMLPDPFPEWFYKVFYGDFALELLLSTRGDFFYIDQKMSVYNKNVANSMSINGPRGNESLKKQLYLLYSFKSEFRSKFVFSCNYAIAKVRFAHFRSNLYLRFPFLETLKDIILRHK